MGNSLCFSIFFLVVVVFVSLFSFVFVFVFFLLCSLDAILSKFVYVFIESPVKKMKKPFIAMAEIDKFEESLQQKEIIKPE